MVNLRGHAFQLGFHSFNLLVHVLDLPVSDLRYVGSLSIMIVKSHWVFLSRVDNWCWQIFEKGSLNSWDGVVILMCLSQQSALIQ